MRSEIFKVALALEWKVKILQEQRDDLLQALEQITLGLNDGEDTRPLIRGEEVAAARAAIAKAKDKGESK